MNKEQFGMAAALVILPAPLYLFSRHKAFGNGNPVNNFINRLPDHNRRANGGPLHKIHQTASIVDGDIYPATERRGMKI